MCNPYTLKNLENKTKNKLRISIPGSIEKLAKNC